MGVRGLHEPLKRYVRRTNITDLQFRSVGVDAYAWLYNCDELDGGGNPRYTAYFHYMVDTLEKLRIEPYLVFDGKEPPVKSDMYVKVRKRLSPKKKAAHEVIMAMEARDIKCLVAPYETDAQLTYMVLNGIVEAAITEDSDYLPYGCPKLDKMPNLQYFCVNGWRWSYKKYRTKTNVVMIYNKRILDEEEGMKEGDETSKNKAKNSEEVCIPSSLPPTDDNRPPPPFNPFADMSSTYKAQAANIVKRLTRKANAKVIDLMPGIDRLPKTHNLAKRFRLYLDFKDLVFSDQQALFTIKSFAELKADEERLFEDLGISSVSEGRENFRSLILANMEKEAEILNIDLEETTSQKDQSLGRDPTPQPFNAHESSPPAESPKKSTEEEKEPSSGPISHTGLSKQETENLVPSICDETFSLNDNIRDVKHDVDVSKESIKGQSAEKKEHDAAVAQQIEDVEQLQGHLGTLFPNLTTFGVAKLVDIQTNIQTLEKIEKEIKQLVTLTTNSDSAANKTTDAIHSNISALISFQTSLEDDVRRLENATKSLSLTVKSLHDVKKGEDGNKV
ncbi:hypothetical protein OROMI_029715 [Orobanche minor]